MRVILMFFWLAVTIALVIVLNSSLVAPVPLGKLLSPQHGVWQNAEPVDEDFSLNVISPQLKGKVTAYLDDRLVPHVFAEQERDAYFVQGFIHAKFRLWQMELQTLAAAGRASEIIGEKAVHHDREFRRLGMVYAAERSLVQMENDPVTKMVCDAYTAGVNAYIGTLNESNLPLEYKLLGYTPEQWSNLKTALFLKYMSYDLAGAADDFEMTNALNYFSKDDFKKLYPDFPDSSDAIIPAGTPFAPPSKVVVPPLSVDSLYFNSKDTFSVFQEKPDKENGSNNWAVSGKKTRSGYPILCNDPHLGLNLPSLWFEMQISTPTFNAYGATFPGAPSVVIGFNDSCAFGFTNGGRDVKDFYRITFKDDSRQEYWFDSAWHKTEFRIEKILVKNAPVYYDTVAYTVFGPVMYDKSFGGTGNNKDQYLAVRWKAHDPSNDLKCFVLLNKAKNYSDYLAAVANLHTPGQNCAFACKNGDIALRTQGEFPAKWKGQGDFIMPGTDGSYRWQAMIPNNEIPSQFNPERGFISSANQRPADTAYPYYLGRGYPPYRGYLINRSLRSMENVTVKDMESLQTNVYDVFAEMARPLFLKNMLREQLSAEERSYFELLQTWNLEDAPGAKGATVFALAWKNFEEAVWNDDFEKMKGDKLLPYESTLLDGVLKDSAFKFIDDVNTPQVETLPEIITSSFKKAVIELKKEDAAGNLAWGNFKDTRVMHLTKLDALSRLHLNAGGGTHCINATKDVHGPSWRMVVSLTPETEAYGVYPGGQNGNPGSKYYDNFIDTWVAGKYFPLWIMKKADEKNKKIQWVMNFSAS